MELELIYVRDYLQSACLNTPRIVTGTEHLNKGEDFTIRLKASEEAMYTVYKQLLDVDLGRNYN